MTPQVWRIELLGWLRAARGSDVHTKFSTQKTASLLGYLALHPGGAFTREELAEQLWPDAPGRTSRHNLRMALHVIRRVLEPPDVDPGSVLSADRDSVRLEPSAFTTD